MGNIGNMFFCLVNIISQFFPFVTPQMINSSELFDFSEIDGQQIVTLRQDKMKELFDSLNFDVEINNYYETDKILEQLIKTEQSEALYVLIAMTGKNPIAPFQWVNISDCFATVISSRFKITESEYTNGFKYMIVEFKKNKD